MIDVLPVLGEGGGHDISFTQQLVLLSMNSILFAVNET